jgi:hypothetical protein
MGPRGQEPNESTDDAVWKDLVARLEGSSNDSDRSSAPQDVPDEDSSGRPYGTYLDPGADRPDAGHEGQTDRERVDAIFRDQPLVPGGPRDYTPPDQPDEDEGFTPEEPPPLGTGDPLTILAWIGAAGGPIMLLLFAMFWRNAPVAAWLGLLLVFLAGAGYLVTKLPRHRDIGDDGAEV